MIGTGKATQQIALPYVYGLAIFLSVILAHAIDFFLHEFAHSFTAWALGWKDNPFALNYGKPTIDNILMQQQIDENVRYTPIFAAHSGIQGALIAAAGPLIANGGGSIICGHVLRAIGRQPLQTVWSITGMWLFTWLAAFNVFNVWSYAPLRALSSHGDMALIAEGLGVPNWLIFPIVTGFAFWLAHWYVQNILPNVHEHFSHFRFGTAFGGTVLGTTIPFFSIVGMTGNYGLPSALMCIASLFLFTPAMLAMFYLSLGQR
ncbi:hypothetical protein [Acetobacter indonesiensis]|uniref:hypothetical protein n=1 Tax=Acetobacter indonesiensis TaxID=104101 RepID=UPI001FD20CD7|nr:hypothetical protein [Acetobacter indonesiensis]